MTIIYAQMLKKHSERSALCRNLSCRYLFYKEFFSLRNLSFNTFAFRAGAFVFNVSVFLAAVFAFCKRGDFFNFKSRVFHNRAFNGNWVAGLKVFGNDIGQFSDLEHDFFSPQLYLQHS